ncbi:unnamed protein product [Hermetia illucens]|uniref:Peroxisomal membrane protein PEX14 n=1 Tax=Hermetia illucens TaxID=343691 RepID=A0A7R8YMF4_HERIL|nr:peroxisomal membrane protein PEX14 [Hermetia illucens]CAD7078576.1 unnamed protein product [Hermetia illucens]
MSNTDTGDTTGGSPASLQVPPREALIATAVNFLQNANVVRSPLQQKQKFLRSKGLTEEEIQIACERAGVFSTDPNSTVINMGITTSAGSGQGYRIADQRPTTLMKIKDALSSIALVSGLAYAVYLFYKKFIEPFLFGKKKRKTVEECIEKMESKVENQIKDLNQEVLRIREELARSSHQDFITQEIGSFKSDLEAIKGLLLNRKQFANPLPMVPPSIPAWQLTSQRHSETEPDKNDDAGSGSGSSETEVVTKNSDSSLEIM